MAILDTLLVEHPANDGSTSNISYYTLVLDQLI